MSHAQKLEGQLALVSGATRGIAVELASAGAKLGCTDSDANRPDAEKLREQPKPGARAFWRDALDG